MLTLTRSYFPETGLSADFWHHTPRIHTSYWRPAPITLNAPELIENRKKCRRSKFDLCEACLFLLDSFLDNPFKISLCDEIGQTNDRSPSEILLVSMVDSSSIILSQESFQRRNSVITTSVNSMAAFFVYLYGSATPQSSLIDCLCSPFPTLGSLCPQIAI